MLQGQCNKVLKLIRKTTHGHQNKLLSRLCRNQMTLRYFLAKVCQVTGSNICWSAGLAITMMKFPGMLLIGEKDKSVMLQRHGAVVSGHHQLSLPEPSSRALVVVNRPLSQL
mmetsp:Transcript_9906/g.60428  ORF Transcript_9906/g.60428 Transcript_9906/m.60428 type:complete len:112 (-) Transcript_9906:900-1235(-)